MPNKCKGLQKCRERRLFCAHLETGKINPLPMHKGENVRVGLIRETVFK